ncbi:hypothetical protein V6N12_060623 [Hibiscus sabdariffa]|uniref:Uncharacterized protein n=1 Tax=Hibiscus sabdariffa TaxID=183260 RepID=A0ABR2D5E1_9ROSI
MVDEGCTWRWALFQHLLPLPVLLRIAATKDPSPLFPDDEVGWGLCSDLRFWVKSAYEVHRGYASGEYERIWTTIHSFRDLHFYILFFLCPFTNGSSLTFLGRFRQAAINLRGIFCLRQFWCQGNVIVFGGIVDEWGSIITRSRWLADTTRNALARRCSLSQLEPAVSLPAPC